MRTSDLVNITNIEEEEQEITPVAVIPVHGTSADSLRDHRHGDFPFAQTERHNGERC